MIVEKLKLINFRNYEDLEISFSENKNIIYGYNAQGKTNILEALYFTSCGRSHRTKRDKELIKWDNNESYISTFVKKNNLDVKIDIKLSKIDKKEIRINGSPIKKIGELFGNLNSVIFSPEDLKLIKEGPSERRRFIDIGISQMKPSYFYNLQQYFKVLNHRNALLKDIRKNNKLREMIPIWDNNIVEIGSKIMYYRNDYLKKISEYSANIHSKISNEELLIKYIPSVNVENLKDIESIKNSLNEKLTQNIERDMNTGLTSVGPHRDNFDIFINKVNTRTFGSQGQQRTAALSLKLAEVELFYEVLGEYPILLLDDVMSELDDNRQEFLLSYLDNVQVFITCTSMDKYKDYNAKFFNIYNGILDDE